MGCMLPCFSLVLMMSCKTALLKSLAKKSDIHLMTAHAVQKQCCRSCQTGHVQLLVSMQAAQPAMARIPTPVPPRVFLLFLLLKFSSPRASALYCTPVEEVHTVVLWGRVMRVMCLWSRSNPTQIDRAYTSELLTSDPAVHMCGPSTLRA